MSAVNQLPLVLCEPYGSTQILDIPDGSHPQVRHDFTVDGKIVVIYSTQHASEANLKTWVTNPTNLYRIKTTLPVRATNLNFFDVDSVPAPQTVASSSRGTAPVPVSTATGGVQNNNTDYYQLPQDRSGSTREGGSSASTGIGAGYNPDYYQLPKDLQDSLGYSGSSTR